MEVNSEALAHLALVSRTSLELVLGRISLYRTQTGRDRGVRRRSSFTCSLLLAKRHACPLCVGKTERSCATIGLRHSNFPIGRNSSPLFDGHTVLLCSLFYGLIFRSAFVHLFTNSSA